MNSKQENQSSHDQVYLFLSVNGGWGAWGNWSTCSVTCGNGTRYRDRECDNPSPSAGGDECDGNATENQTCNDQDCPGIVMAMFFLRTYN